jgi:hypothetical protein
MNFTITHIGNGFIDSTSIEWSSAVTRAEADRLSQEIGELLDGTLRERTKRERREHNAEMEELNQRNLDLQTRLDGQLKKQTEMAKVRSETFARIVEAATAPSIRAVDAYLQRMAATSVPSPKPKKATRKANGRSA